MTDPIHPDQPYTPSGDEIREAVLWQYDAGSKSEQVGGELFDRWLASVRRDAQAEQRETDAALAESRHDLPVGADTTGRVFMQSTARFPDDGRRIADAIRRNENGDQS